MPSYLFQASGPDGTTVSDRIEADNLGQAGYALQQRGYREVRFLDDENADDLRRMTEADCNAPPVGPDLWTPKDEIESRRRRGGWSNFWWAFQQHFFIIAPLVTWNVLSFFHGRPFRWSDWLGFVVTPCYLGYFLLIVAPGQVFHQILDASVWKDWRRLRFFIRVARALRAVMGMGVPENEMRIREAYALADEGQLDEALRKMETVRTDPNVKEYYYLARLATVYEFAGRYDQQISCLREAQRLGTGGASEWIDLAMALVRRGGDVAGAKAALDCAKEKEIPELARLFVTWCEGIIACEEGDFVSAKCALRAALQSSESIGSQLMVGARADMKAFLCIACARSGEGDEAQKLWAECRALLIARKERDLVQRCRGALAPFAIRSSD